MHLVVHFLPTCPTLSLLTVRRTHCCCKSWSSKPAMLVERSTASPTYSCHSEPHMTVGLAHSSSIPGERTATELQGLGKESLLGELRSCWCDEQRVRCKSVASLCRKAGPMPPLVPTNMLHTFQFSPCFRLIAYVAVSC
jgi:hypothetical protein